MIQPRWCVVTLPKIVLALSLVLALALTLSLGLALALVLDLVLALVLALALALGQFLGGTNFAVTVLKPYTDAQHITCGSTRHECTHCVAHTVRGNVDTLTLWGLVLLYCQFEIAGRLPEAGPLETLAHSMLDM